MSKSATRRLGSGLFVLLMTLCLCQSGFAARVWYSGENTVADLEQGTGESSGGLGLQVQWKDAQVNFDQPDRAGDYETIGLLRRNSGPPAHGQAHGIISLDGLFGNLGLQIPDNAAITSAYLYVYHDAPWGAQAISVDGLAPADADWDESAASFNERASGAAWSGGATIENSCIWGYGMFSPPAQGTAPGWFQIPLDVKDALADYRAGNVGGMVLKADDEDGFAINSVYFHSDEHPDVATRPGLLVGLKTIPGSLPAAIVGISPANGSHWWADGQMSIYVQDATNVTVGGASAVQVGESRFVFEVMTNTLDWSGVAVVAQGENGDDTILVDYHLGSGDPPEVPPPHIDVVTPASPMGWRADGDMFIGVTHATGVTVNGVAALPTDNPSVFVFPVDVSEDLPFADAPVVASGPGGTDVRYVTYTEDPNGDWPPRDPAKIAAIYPSSGARIAADRLMQIWVQNATGVTVNGSAALSANLQGTLYTFLVETSELPWYDCEVRAYGPGGDDLQTVSYVFDPDVPVAAPFIGDIQPPDGTVWRDDAYMYVQVQDAERVWVGAADRIADPINPGLYRLWIATNELPWTDVVVGAEGPGGTASDTVSYTAGPDGTWPDPAAPIVTDVVPADGTAWHDAGWMWIEGVNISEVYVDGALAQVANGDGTLFQYWLGTNALAAGGEFAIVAVGPGGTATQTVSYVWDPVDGTWPTDASPVITDVVPPDGTVWRADGWMYVYVQDASGVTVNNGAASMLTLTLYRYHVATNTLPADMAVRADGPGGFDAATVFYDLDPINGDWPSDEAAQILSISPPSGTVWSDDGYMHIYVTNATDGVQVGFGAGLPALCVDLGHYRYPILLADLPWYDVPVVAENDAYGSDTELVSYDLAGDFVFSVTDIVHPTDVWTDVVVSWEVRPFWNYTLQASTNMATITGGEAFWYDMPAAIDVPGYDGTMSATSSYVDVHRFFRVRAERP